MRRRNQRYDTSLLVERGQVTSGMSPNYNDYRAAYGYDRDFDPRNAEYWRRPADLRGEVRGGAAFSYGYGNDYDRVYHNPRNSRRLPGDWGNRGRPAGYWGRWLGAEGYPGGGLDRDAWFARGYDLRFRGYGRGR